MAVGVRRPGEFCWINVLSPEPAKACDFFAKVLGWTPEQVEREIKHYRLRVEAERASQEQPDDQATMQQLKKLYAKTGDTGKYNAIKKELGE